MKYLVVLSLIAAVASAGYLKPSVVDSAVAEVQEIIAAINSPSTDPATAAALEQLLLDTLGISSAQDTIGGSSPIAIGPALVEFEHDGGAVTAETPAIVPAPVVAATPAATPAADAAAPLVQIILNINQANSDAPAVAPTPAEAPVVPSSPVHIVDEAVNVDTVVPTPVQVAEVAPIPVQVAEVPVLPEAPAVINLPDILN